MAALALTFPSSSPFVSSSGSSAVATAPLTTYFIGVAHLVKVMNDIVKTSTLAGRVSILLDPICEKEGHVTFGRDWRVALLDGTHLIPYSLNEDDVWLPYKSLLPPQNKSIILDGISAGTGLGVEKKFHDVTVALSREQHIPVVEGRSCIEGGNCLLFTTKDGKPRALVGITSIALTLVALEKQGYFEEHKERLETKKASFTHVEKEYYRSAKNRNLAKEFMPYYMAVTAAKKARDTVAQAKIYVEMKEKFGGISGVTAEFLKDIEEDVEYLHYYLDALDIKAKWEMAQELIASELRIPLENIAFLPQLKYHIDFHVFANHEGQVFIHDESLAKAALYRCTATTKEEAELIEKYKETSAKKMKDALEWKDAVVKAIGAIGCEVVLVPGVFEDSEGVHPLNFMNALILQEGSDSVLITASSTLSSLNETFLSAISTRATALKVAGLDPRIMEDLLKSCTAGLHCISWEKKVSTLYPP